MRVPVIADVRGDLDALRSVLAAIDRCEADQIWCLGDIVGLGATTPVEVVDLVRERCASALAGNHDRRGTGQLTPDMLPLPRQRAQLQGQRRALSNDQLAWLGSPPQPLNPASRTRLVDTENSTACGPPPGASAAAVELSLLLRRSGTGAVPAQPTPGLSGRDPGGRWAVCSACPQEQVRLRLPPRVSPSFHCESRPSSWSTSASTPALARIMQARGTARPRVPRIPGLPASGLTGASGHQSGSRTCRSDR
jgi:hypothetical protein